VGLEVMGAFDAEGRPAMLKEMGECGSPKKLYKHSKGDFINRTAILTRNSMRMEKEVSGGCPQDSCSAPGN